MADNVATGTSDAKYPDETGGGSAALAGYLAVTSGVESTGPVMLL